MKTSNSTIRRVALSLALLVTTGLSSPAFAIIADDHGCGCIHIPPWCDLWVIPA